MPSQIPLKIEKALYVANLSDEDRLQACLAAHACLLGREHAPRHFIRPAADMTQRAWGKALTACLRLNPASITQATIALVRSLGIVQDCRAATRAERMAALGVIEDIIFDGWGVGRIHYEMARFTPFTQGDISLLLPPSKMPWSAETRYLFERLRLRLEHQDKFRQEHVGAEHANQHCTYARVHREKVEAEWQKLWLDSASYADDSEVRLISAMTLLKENR